MTSFKADYRDYFENLPQNACSVKEKTVSFATGAAAYPLMCDFAKKIEENIPQIKVKVYKIKNEFFGESITVAGLITGRDLINQLKGKDLGQALFISSNMIIGSYQEENENIFLDDVTLSKACEELSVNIIPVSESVSEIMQKISEVQ